MEFEFVEILEYPSPIIEILKEYEEETAIVDVLNYHLVSRVEVFVPGPYGLVFDLDNNNA